jgi:hypothetical protein
MMDRITWLFLPTAVLVLGCAHMNESAAHKGIAEHERHTSFPALLLQPQIYEVRVPAVEPASAAGKVCLTRYGMCPTAPGLPQNLSCTCYLPQGPVPGFTQ